MAFASTDGDNNKNFKPRLHALVSATQLLNHCIFTNSGQIYSATNVLQKSSLLEFRFSRSYNCGNFDHTFGRVLGASLYIDDIDVKTASGPGVVVNYINVRDQDSANIAIGFLNTANEQAATFLAYMDALQKRLTAAIANLTLCSQNQVIAEGRIEDADHAKETATLTKQQILCLAALQMLVNAQKSKTATLSLI